MRALRTSTLTAEVNPLEAAIVAAPAIPTQLRGKLAEQVQPRVLRTFEGTVVRTNLRNRGILLTDGYEGWVNLSRFGEIARLPLPRPESRVRAQVDERDFVQTLEVLSEPASIVATAPRGPAPEDTPLRLAVLQAAATFGSGRDWADNVVLATAEKWLAWVQS